MDLAVYDVVIINTSAGKDSQTMLRYVATLAREQGVLGRCLAVHAALGRVEWPGVVECAHLQAALNGVRCVAIARAQGDVLEHVEKRGMWPSPRQRYCTSDHKRAQVSKIITKYRGRILNCLGMRAEESPARATLPVLKRNERLTTKTRWVYDWLPIHDWTEAQVWADIRASKIPYHPAYDLGMERLSCCLCIYADKASLVLAGRHNPELLDEYVRVEKKIHHRFRANLSIAEIKQLVEAGVDIGKPQNFVM